jgi:hypothetical protein
MYFVSAWCGSSHACAITANGLLALFPYYPRHERPISAKNVPTANTPTHKSSAGRDSTYFPMSTHLYEQFMNLLFEIYWFSYPMIWVE